MGLEFIENKTGWEKFLEESGESTLLQSWNWGEFAKAQGREVFRVGERDSGGLRVVAQLTKVESRRGNYLECHQGPVYSKAQPPLPSKFLKYLKHFTKEQNADFLRVRLPYQYNQQLVAKLTSLGFHHAPMYFPAEHTLLLDLAPSEEGLLAKMRKNTRYGVRRAGREGVVVSRLSDVGVETHCNASLQQFFRLYETTVDRQEFVPYGYDYFKNETEAFARDNQAEIFLADWRGEAVAAAVVLYHGDYAYYHHAASVRTDPDVYAPYAVLWEVIKSARSRGKKYLDFWGVAPAVDSKLREYEYSQEHPRAGLTLFKEGFGGEYVRYMPTMDLPLSPKYYLTYAYVKYERWRRKL